MMRRLVLAALIALAPLSAGAVEPHEMLDDPGLEARARDISAELRCLVCRNESIEESNAELASDLRVLVRERVAAGDTDAEVMSYVTDRYGEFVLLRPNARGANLILWFAGPVVLCVALGVAIVYVRRRQASPAPEDIALSAAESARLDRILQNEPSSRSLPSPRKSLESDRIGCI